MRELRNIIERLVMMSTELGAISPEEVAQVLPRQQSVFQGGHLSRCLLGEIERRISNVSLKPPTATNPKPRRPSASTTRLC